MLYRLQLSILLWSLIITSMYSQQNESQISEETKDALKENIEQLKLYSDLIEIAEKENDTIEVIDALLGTAHIYNVQEDTVKSKYYFYKAINLLNVISEEKVSSKIYFHIGNYYNFSTSPNNEKSLYYYKKALYLDKKNNNKENILTISMSIAVLYAKNFGDGEMGNTYLEPITEQLKMNKQLSINTLQNYYAVKGVFHFNRKNYEKSVDFFNKAIYHGLKIESNNGIPDFYNLKAEAFQVLNKKDSVIAAIKKHYAFREKQLSLQKLKQSALLHAQFEESQIKKDIKKVNELNLAYSENARKSKIIIFFTVISIVILLFLAIYHKKNNNVVKSLNEKLIGKNKDLITARQKAEQLSSIKSNFINTVSHELRTPLYAVTGITSILLDDEKINKENHENLASLKISSEYLLHLINDLLQLSKIDNNKIEVKVIPFQVKPLVQNLIQSLDTIRSANGNSIHIEMNTALPYVLIGDKIKIQQILFNIVGNALKFTQNGDVFVRINVINVKEDDILLKIEIEDNGVGIPLHKQKEVFNEFSQLARNNASSFEGTGLGLSIVSKLVKLLQGEINLISEERKGTTFTLTLPLKKGETKQIVDVNPNAIEPNSLSARILVVDDNKINRMVTKNILKKENFLVEVCENGALAVDAVKEGSFDLILMDLNMPLMNGFEATEMIREFNTIIPIIALTATSSDELLSDIKKSGMQDIITKPFDKGDFFHAISQNLNVSKNHEKTIEELIYRGAKFENSTKKESD